MLKVRKIGAIQLLVLAVLLVSISSFGQLRLPEIICSDMLIQRDKNVQIWGWADPNEHIEVVFRGNSVTAITGEGGEWNVLIPSGMAGGPFEMSINGTTSLTLKNILVGDVWICSGQSNMEYPMNRLKDKYEDEIKKSSNSNIRQFKVGQGYDFNGPKSEIKTGSWKEANPENILDFSAVGYFFAKELYEKYKVPIGIINAAVGGSPIEAWMSSDALSAFPDYLAEATKFKSKEYIHELQAKERELSSEWYSTLNLTDMGLHSEPDWKDPDLDVSDWKEMPVPSFWNDHGLTLKYGAVWFRKEILIPESMSEEQTWIQLGRMVDADSVFINGKFVGTTSYQYPQRKYPIQPGILLPGRNVIVVRLISNSGKGGFIRDKPYRLFSAKETIELSGSWKYKAACEMPYLPGQTFVQWKPTGLYNGMIAPLENFEVKGVCWYQGESNESRPEEYKDLLASMISDWRLKRGQADLPFVIAQLPNFLEPKALPSESNWAVLRFAQLEVAKTTPNTALTVNIDLGEWNDIHPQNKQTVGKRLAIAAMGMVYDEKDIVSSGPCFESIKVKGKKLELSFSNYGGGLMIKDEKELQSFAIAGEDMVFMWAKAKIKGNRIIVWNKSIANPKTVRYAWADNPDNANLVNAEGFPASPFSASLKKGD